MTCEFFDGMIALAVCFSFGAGMLLMFGALIILDR